MIIYDFEVFEKDWLAVFKKNIAGSFVITEIINDRDKLLEYYDENKEELFIGFNNKSYDDYIFKVILCGGDPKRASDIIIEEQNVIKLWGMYDLNKYPLISMDTSQNGGWASLKELEGFMGMEIEESDVPFDIKRNLTPDEIQDVLKYCRHDVEATHEVVKKSTSEIRTKMELVKEFNLSSLDLKHSGAKLSERILGASVVKKYDDELKPYTPPKDLIIEKYKSVLDFYTNPKNDKLDYSSDFRLDVAGVPHIFAFGGLHGAIKKFHYEGELLLIDVGSYYPSLMIHHGFMSRGIPDKFKSRFKTIYDTRMDMKARGLSGANHYKLILNTTYGCMKNKYNGLYDPHNANNVCITGQLFLLDLIEKLEPYCTLTQSNTDGILVIPHDKDMVLEVVREWSERTKMPVDIDEYRSMYQKDVNNYIMVSEDGYVSLKGGMVAQSNINGKTNPIGRKSNAVVDDALVNYLVKGVPIKDTIYNEIDPLRFQIISKTGNTFYKTIWNYDGEQIPIQKVNRVFATKDPKAGSIQKVKRVNGEDRYSLPANTPRQCVVNNDDITSFDLDTVDRDWYVALAEDRLRQYKE